MSSDPHDPRNRQTPERFEGGESQFAGRVAFITGASSGVGEAVAKQLVAAGARVALMARRPEPLHALAEQLGHPEDVLVTPGDVRRSADVNAAVAATIASFGTLDIAIISAAVGRIRFLDDLDDEAWASNIDTNLTGAFYVCRAAGLHMRDHGGGAIVTIASSYALVGVPGYAAYCASKGGMVQLTRAVAAELAPSVRVNCLCPGGIETPMTDDNFELFPDPTGARRESIARTPLQRHATAEEVAGAALWLASDAAGFATGSIIALDGGATMI